MSDKDVCFEISFEKCHKCSALLGFTHKLKRFQTKGFTALFSRFDLPKTVKKVRQVWRALEYPVGRKITISSLIHGVQVVSHQPRMIRKNTLFKGFNLYLSS